MVRIVALLFLLSFSVWSEGQEVVRYKFDHFTPKSGLSGIFTRKIIQDPYGFIWIGTEDGLNRYNGSSFSIYNKVAAGKHVLTGSDIRDLVLDTAHQSIWSVNSYGGIDQVDYRTGNVIYQYNQSRDNQTKELLLRTMALYKGQLYVGSSQGVFVLDISTKVLKKLSLDSRWVSESADLVVNEMLIDHSERLWIFCEGQGICLLNPKTNSILTSKPIPYSVPATRFYDVCELQDGSVLCATNKGLLQYRCDPKENYIKELNAPTSEFLSPAIDVYACAQDRSGNIWLSQADLLLRINASTHRSTVVRENISRAEHAWLGAVYFIYFDRSNDVWLGCQQGTAHAITKPAPFLQLTGSSVSETRIGHAYYLQPVSDSVIYACAQDGLYEVHTNSDSIVAVKEKLPYYHFFIDPFGRKVVANLKGSFILQNKSLLPLEKLYPAFKPFGKIIINSHCYAGDSLVVMGTENDRGIFVWNYKKGTVVNINDSTPGPQCRLKENTINTVYTDHRSRVWILGDHSISLLNLTTFQTSWLPLKNPEDQSSFSIFFDVCQVKNKYFIASYGAGVLVLDSGLRFEKQISVKDGLTANSVYKILPWRDSLLFVTSNNGITQLEVDHLSRVKKYYDTDGLHGNVFEENSGSIFQDVIFAGGEKGVTRIAPALLYTNPNQSQVYIEQIRVETSAGHIDTANLLLKTIRIPSNVVQTTIYFSYNDLSNNGRNVFSYRIRELSESWLPLPGVNFISLSGLAPGKYTLEISARSENDEHKASFNSITLEVSPKWYQTTAFKLAIILLTLGILYAFYRYRIAQIKKQQQIRRSIASDLHDDIGNTLTAAKVYAHLAKKEPPGNGYLDRLEESLSQVTLSLRDILWVLDDSEDSLYQLGDRIKKFSLPLAQARNILIEFTIKDESSKRLSKTEKRNLLLMTKEAIYNSIKHSQSTKISVSITRSSNGKVRIVVTDNGKGFNTTAAYEGYGMKNIRLRAEQISYTASVHSSSSGTTVALEN